MARAIVLVMDSLGVGATPDADTFGDVGANTLGHIAEWCAAGKVSADRPIAGALNVPRLASLGLGKCVELATGELPKGFEVTTGHIGNYGACKELSSGKDTPSGHWEMMGVPVLFDWAYFPHEVPCFPPKVTDALIEQAGLAGILGNCHASGTTILEELGNEHIATGKPIFYTSADSVLQIAAHEEHFGLERLYVLCEAAREILNDHNVGRVIARPFVGEDGSFTRTGNRKDYTVPPHGDTLLDILTAKGREVISVGKIADIFAHRGFSLKIKATGHDALFDATLDAMKTCADGGLVFTNFVEFDQSFGHRRNVGGYAVALEHFDGRIDEVMAQMKEDDLLILTADHGCDPTREGSEHTREHVPFVAYSPSLGSQNLGIRESFADIGATLAKYLKVEDTKVGTAAF